VDIYVDRDHLTLQSALNHAVFYKLPIQTAISNPFKIKDLYFHGL